MYITTLKKCGFLVILVYNFITVKIQSKSTYLRNAVFNVFLPKMHTFEIGTEKLH